MVARIVDRPPVRHPLAGHRSPAPASAVRGGVDVGRLHARIRGLVAKATSWPAASKTRGQRDDGMGCPVTATQVNRTRIQASPRLRQRLLADNAARRSRWSGSSSSSNALSRRRGVPHDPQPYPQSPKPRTHDHHHARELLSPGSLHSRGDPSRSRSDDTHLGPGTDGASRAPDQAKRPPVGDCGR
jgi:hypothetical protein